MATIWCPSSLTLQPGGVGVRLVCSSDSSDYNVSITVISVAAPYSVYTLGSFARVVGLTNFWTAIYTVVVESGHFVSDSIH